MIVAGGRDFNPLQCHYDWIAKVINQEKPTEIVSGTCSGADKFGEKAAIHYGIKIKQFPADWDKYGKMAGPRRNAQMAEYADICVLFPGGKGTDNMRRLAHENGLKVIEYGR